jgi:hypothetical protein
LNIVTSRRTATPRDRKPEGKIALSSAERQARYRARQPPLQPPAAITRELDLKREQLTAIEADLAATTQSAEAA